jgi:hypothetical protein
LYLGDKLPAISHTATAIAITTRLAPMTYGWHESDPKGYAAWFKKRMEQEFKRILKEKRAHIEMVPEYSVRTSLQVTVQLLKRHRDMMFKGHENAPISVIITTLAARAYQGSASLADTVVRVTKGMRAEIEWNGGRPIIRNPVRTEENFADRWEGAPEKQAMFFTWLDAVEIFADELERLSPEELKRPLTLALGESMADTAIRKYAAMRRDDTVARMLAEAAPFTSAAPLARTPSAPPPPALWQSASHREALRWPEAPDVTRLPIAGRVTGGRGARIGPLRDSTALAPGADLKFEASFDVRPGDSVYWQIVNTGTEAQKKGQLRGSFEFGTTSKIESALYLGDHFIECFLIRNGACVARSGPFTVRVR